MSDNLPVVTFMVVLIGLPLLAYFIKLWINGTIKNVEIVRQQLEQHGKDIAKIEGMLMVSPLHTHARKERDKSN